MAGNSGAMTNPAVIFLDKVNKILPDVTPQIVDQLFDLLKSADVRSEADFNKVDGSKLANIVGFDNAVKLLDYFRNQRNNMAGNSGFTKNPTEILRDKVIEILPDVTTDIMDELFALLESAGVRSEVDFGKVDGSKLADVVGFDNAVKLLDYFKKQKPEKGEAPRSSASTSSSESAAPQVMTVSRRPQDGSEVYLGMFEMVMKMQAMQHERDREIAQESQKSQTAALEAVTTAMKEMSTMHKGTLDKMSEQMTQQSKLHKETIQAMNTHMTATASMHQKTLETVHHGMREAQKMNADTLTHVTSTLTTALEGQEKRMQESNRKQSQMHQEAMQAMNAHMQTTAQMHADTLQTVQHSMTEAQRMNSVNLANLSSTMNAALEAHEETMRDYRRRLAEKDDSSCRLM